MRGTQAGSVPVGTQERVEATLGTRGQPDRELSTYFVRRVFVQPARRNGVRSKSETYLTHYVEMTTTVDDIEVYQVMRAAGQVEALLGLAAHRRYDKPTARGVL